MTFITKIRQLLKTKKSNKEKLKEDNMQNVKTFHITSMDEIETHYNEVLKDPTIEGYRCIGGACRKSYGYDPEKDTVLRKEGEFYFSNPSYKKKEESHEEDLEDDDFDIPEDDIVEEVETKEEENDAYLRRKCIFPYMII